MDSRRVFTAKRAAILSVIPMLMWAHSAGPPPGSAGPPSGDVSCGTRLCHINSGDGPGFVRAAFPNGGLYVPGKKQHVVLTLADPTQKRWGFQTTIRPTDAPRSAMSGDLEPTDDFTQVVCSDDSPKEMNKPCPSTDPDFPPFQYIEHTLRGTRNGTPGRITFEFDWTPDSTTAGDLTFYVAANAANGDGTNDGDHIYYQNFALKQALPGGPQIGAVVNGGSFNTGIAAGTWVTIQGVNLASSTRVWTSSDIVNGKLPTQLDDVSVTVGGKPAYVYYISPNQINVLAPAGLDGTSSDVVVKNGQGSASAFTADTTPLAPALFLWPRRYAVAEHADYSLAGKPGLFGDSATLAPVKPGETILLFATGLGQTVPAADPSEVTPAALPLANRLTITIDGLNASYSFAGLAPGFAGLYQVNVAVPSGVSNGDVPVVVDTGNGKTDDAVYLYVQAQ